MKCRGSFECGERERAFNRAQYNIEQCPPKPFVLVDWKVNTSGAKMSKTDCLGFWKKAYCRKDRNSKSYLQFSQVDRDKHSEKLQILQLLLSSNHLLRPRPLLNR